MGNATTTDAEIIREHILDEAVKAAKFPASRKAHYRSLYDQDPKGTKATIASLAPGLPESPEAASDAYPAEWLGPQRPVQAGPVMSDAAPAATGRDAYPREWLGPQDSSPSGPVTFEEGTV